MSDDEIERLKADNARLLGRIGRIDADNAALRDEVGGMAMAAEQRQRIDADEIGRLRAALRSALLVMEAGHKIRNPEWDGSVTSTSVIGEAREVLNGTRAEGEE